MRHPYRAFAMVACIAAFACGALPTRAQAPAGWLHVSVDGVRLSEKDLTQVLLWAFALQGAKPVNKPADAMPTFAHHLWYAGKDAKTGKGIFWLSNADSGHQPSSGEIVKLQREEVAAGVLYALDDGKGTPTLRALYAKTPPNPAQRQQLGDALATALRTWSDQTVAKSNADRTWLYATMTEGLSRADAYAALRKRGLTATSGGANTASFPPSGNVLVTLPGAFQPGCSFSRDVTIQFDKNDRVYKLDLSEPIPDCL